MSVYQSKAFVYKGRPKDVVADTISFECGPRDLVLEVMMCGRCGTDRTIYLHGHPNVDPYAPVVLGHELVGRIVEVGSEVRGLKAGIGYRDGKTLTDDCLDFRIGERVTVQSRIARYRDGLMLIPRPLANLSFQINGGYARYMKVPETMITSESVLRVPEGVSDEEACLVEPAACALEAIFATPHAKGVDTEGRHVFHTGVRPGGNVCIIGAGTVGMMYAAMALAEGVGRVIMVERLASKVSLVKRLLGDRVQVYIPAETRDDVGSDGLAADDAIVSDLSDMTDGYLFDDVVAACAAPQAQRLMLRLYTREGYAVGVCFGGTHRTVDAAELDTHHYRAAKTIGTSGCSTDCMNTILKWLESGRLNFEGFMSSRRFTLDDDPAEFLTTEADGLKPALWMEG